jgi:hypothetical protein
MLLWPVMELHDIFRELGEAHFRELLAQVSMGRLKAYQLYEPFKVRLHLTKLNSETLRKVTPRLWSRVSEGDEEFATELSQAILVSKLDFVIEVLNFLGVPHNDGFFEKDMPIRDHLPENWQQKAYEAFGDKYSPSLVIFYLNHLAKEATEGQASLFLPQSTVA